MQCEDGSVVHTIVSRPLCSLMGKAKLNACSDPATPLRIAPINAVMAPQSGCAEVAVPVYPSDLYPALVDV